MEIARCRKKLGLHGSAFEYKKPKWPIGIGLEGTETLLIRFRYLLVGNGDFGFLVWPRMGLQHHVLIIACAPKLHIGMRFAGRVVL